MPNLLDCPQELRDMIYKAHFSVVKEEPTTPLHTSPLFRSSRAVASEALKIAEPIIDLAVMYTKYELRCSKMRKAQATIAILERLVAHNADPKQPDRTSQNLQEARNQVTTLEKQLAAQERIETGLQGLRRCLEKLTGAIP